MSSSDPRPRRDTTWTLRRRATGEPVAYIRGFKEFFGLAFATDARALIPRPETELLVQLALDEIVRRLTGAPRPAGAPRLRVADIGTGAGPIAVTLAVLLRRRGAGQDVELYATDVSDDALQLAKENAVGHAVADVMRFAVADVLPPVLPGPFDIILANLPYIRSGEIAGLPVAASFEPAVALDGGPDGLTVIRALLARLAEALLPGGAAMLEIGADEAADIGALAAEMVPGWPVRIENDLGGRPRVAVIQRAAG